jgi:SAM-dependent methyltransferase
MTSVMNAISKMIRPGKRVIRKLLKPTRLGYKILLARDEGYSMSPRRPDAPWMNRALRDREEVESSLNQVRSIGLIPHPDAPKNWDALAALDLIIKQTDKGSRVLDAGGEIYSPLVQWLTMYGYRSLHVINLSFKEDFNQGPIKYIHGDCTATPYPQEYFDVVTCLSVIEHGVDLKAFLSECCRILRPGGYLIVSTDYWNESIDTAGKNAYGVPVKVFTQSEIQAFIAMAESNCFESTGEVDCSVGSKVVHWKDVGLDYTFIVFALKKTSHRR